MWNIFEKFMALVDTMQIRNEEDKEFWNLMTREYSCPNLNSHFEKITKCIMHFRTKVQFQIFMVSIIT